MKGRVARMAPAVIAVQLIAVAWCCVQASGRRQQPVPSTENAVHYKAVVAQYCTSCHNERTKTGGLALDKLDFGNLGANAEIWEKAVRKVRVGMMPPQGASQPDDQTRRGLVSWLTTELDHAASANPNPGRPLLHRLNRVEYGNAIRDLLGLEVDPAALLPPDDAAYGFDNVGDVLGRLTRIAGALHGRGRYRQRSRCRRSGHRSQRGDFSHPARRVAGYPTPRNADRYRRRHPGKSHASSRRRFFFTVRLFRTNLGVMRGLEYEHEVEYTVDGRRVHLFKMGGEEDFKANLVNMTKLGDEVDERGRFRIALKAGPHVITAAFLERTAAYNPTRLQPFIRSSTDTRDTSGLPHFETFTVTGPFNATGSGDTPSRHKVFICRPADRAGEEPCARKILSTLARRAYRGDVSETDLQRLIGFFQSARRTGDFDKAIQISLQRIHDRGAWRQGS